MSAAISKRDARGQKRQRNDTGPSLKERAARPKSTEEQRLDALLFGSASSSALVAADSARKGSSFADTELDEDRIESQTGARGRKAAWVDDDDSKVKINIAGTGRLRKLRNDQSEAVISGVDYSSRLRKQFAAGAGNTDWATLPSKTLQRRSSAAEDSDDDAHNDDGEESGAASGTDSEDLEQEEEYDASSVLQSAGGMLASSSAGSGASLQQGTLSLSRLRDANVADPARSVVHAVEYHPAGSVMLTGSMDHRVRFFAVDGKKNSRLASLFLPDLPVQSACWNGDGSEVIITGRRSHFYTYDVAAGKAHRIPRIMGREDKSLESCVVSPGDPSDASSVAAFLCGSGTTVLVSSRTKQWVASLKMEGTVRAAAFTRGPTAGAGGAGPLDYPELLTTGGNGEVYRWDLRTMRCLSRHVDEGSTGSTAIAATPDGRSYAVGSAMGVVNTYDAAETARGAGASSSAAASSLLLAPSDYSPKPIKSVLNLTTAIDTLRYSPDGAMLLMASQRTRDALKMLHVGSGTVFSNWPTDKTPLHFVTAANFSPGGGYLSVGNDRGRVLLYRLHHYSSVS